MLTICNFLLVVASLERYLANGSAKTRVSLIFALTTAFHVSTLILIQCLLVFIVNRKTFVIATIIVLAFLLKATLYFDIRVIKIPECRKEIYR